MVTAVGEDGAHIVVQASLVALRGQDVSPSQRNPSGFAPGHDPGGNGALAVECVGGDDAPLERQQDSPSDALNVKQNQSSPSPT